MKSKLTRILCLLLAVFLICGCAQQSEFSSASTENPVTEPSAVQRLRINAVSDSEACELIPASELGRNLYDGITYIGVADVKIEIDGETIALESAIRDGKTTTAELLAYARLDAQNGFCQEDYTSQNGLTCFLYSYPDFDVHIIYDVYETPDGQQHLIEDLSVYSSGRHANINHYFVDDDSEYGTFIDWEDWGIQFEVENVTPTVLTLNCIQSGGQQIGELQVDYYYNIYSVENGQTAVLPSLQGSGTYTQENLPPPIAKIMQDGTTQFTIDWTDIYGELESGKYRIRLTVDDIFDESQVHPLMQDFYSRQGYWIEFSISR